MDSKEDCFSESHFAETRKSLQEASNLPGFVYSSPEWFEAEMRGIFLREWNCIGRVEQVKNPGDYFTVDIGGELVSVIRNEKNELRAVLPVCRHRAATLLKGAGSCRAIVCPYHGWTYDLSGRLVATPGRHRPMETIKFAPEEHGLVNIRLETWGGFIFINFDPEAPSLLTWLGDLPELARNYRSEDLQSTYTVEFMVDCNWKVYAENSLDEYHVEFIHGKHMAPSNPYLMEVVQAAGPFDCWYNKYYLSAPSGVPLPVIEGLSDAQKAGVYQVHLRPTFELILSPTTVKFMTMYPETLTRTRVSMTWCFPKSTIELPNFKELAAADYYPTTTTVLEEDNEIALDVQRGLATRFRKIGRFSHREASIRSFENYLLDMVFAERKRQKQQKTG
jgi:choline monooxygenase